MYGRFNSMFKKLGVLSLTLSTICGSALAQNAVVSRPLGYERPAARQEVPLAVEQQQYYHDSGTAGRIGLGASPFHPEGPGNFTHR